MAEDIRYNVVAQMGVRGWQGLRRMAGALRPVWNNMSAIEQRLSGMGKTIRGTTQQTAAGWARTAGTIASVAGPAAMGGILHQGLSFNRTLENANLQSATMMQMFDFGAKAAEVVSGEISQWQYNIQAAEAVMKQLYKVAEKSPATFKDVAGMYQQVATGLATQTQDLQRHVKFMERASLLGGLAGGDMAVLGAQMGRIMAGSAGAEMNVWKVLQKPILEAGQQMGSFNDKLKMGAELTQAFNELQGDDRLRIMMQAMEKIGPDVAESFAMSMDGIVSTTQSGLDKIFGKVTAPLYENIRQALIRVNKEGGVFGKDPLNKLDDMAETMGIKLARYADVWFRRIEGAAVFLRDNWVEVSAYIQNAGEVLAGMIKGAFAWGLARWMAGTAMLMGGRVAKAGAMAKDLGAALRPIFARQAKLTHAAIVRGAHGKRGGLLGRMGKMLGARTNRTRYAGGDSFLGGRMGRGGSLGADMFRGVASALAKFASLGTVLFAGAAAAALLAAALGSALVIIGGISAYVVSNWKAISSALVQGLRDGTLTLRPLLTAAYAFWARLKLVGQWLLGGSNHATQFSTVMGWVVKAFEFASGAISFFLRTMAFFLGIWATLKLAFQGVMRAVLGIVEAASYLPGGPSDETVANARANYEKYSRGVDETLASGAELLRMADKVDNFEFQAFEMEALQKEADEMAKSLADMLEGKGAEEEKRKTPGAKVNVENMHVEVDLRDEDPDRMMSMFLTPLQRLAEHRTQSGMLPAGGV